MRRGGRRWVKEKEWRKKSTEVLRKGAGVKGGEGEMWCGVVWSSGERA